MSRRRAWTILLPVMVGVGVAVLCWVVLGPVPDVDPKQFAGTRIVDRNGEVLFEPLAADGTRSEWVRDVPPRVAQATVAAEDRRFFSHPGVDPLAIVRAGWHDVRRGGLVEGGSTLTQQVAKMLGGRGQRSVLAKVHEAVIAIRLERHFTKSEILALYVNLAPYGNRIQGIGRASRRYFGCPPEELTVAQAAFLAALPQRPSAFNPVRDPARALGRQRYVFSRMQALHFISPDERSLAAAERLRFDPAAALMPAQHFVERVLALLSGRSTRAFEDAGRATSEHDADLPDGKQTIVTTLDSRLQRTVQGIIAAHRDDLLRHGAHSVAVAVLDNASGEWLAWEGSGDYYGTRFGGAIDGVAALRQPGSTLKPFTYALAFERGDSPATVLADLPSSFPTAEAGVVYTPRNYDGRYRGPLRARAALAGSENVPAVALLSRVGAPSLLRLLRNGGFSDLDHTAQYYGLGLTLGDAEVRLEQLVAGYSMFARGGVFVEPRLIRNRCADGRPVAFGRPCMEKRLLSERAAFWITDILSDSEARAFIFGTGGSLDFPFPVAVKTGTSQAYRDNWTVGYSRDVTVGVWVGNFGREELHGSSGVTGAGPIFHDVMLAASRGEDAPILAPTADLERVEVCALSGLRPSLSCPATESEWVRKDAAVDFCSWHRAGGVVDWPDEYRAWARTSQLPVIAHPREVRNASVPLRVVNPPDGATYLIDPTLRMPYQTLPLRAVSRTSVAWQVDGKGVGSSPRDRQLDWPLKPGVHTIAAADSAGNHAAVKIYVK